MSESDSNSIVADLIDTLARTGDPLTNSFRGEGDPGRISKEDLERLAYLGDEIADWCAMGLQGAGSSLYWASIAEESETDIYLMGLSKNIQLLSQLQRAAMVIGGNAEMALKLGKGTAVEA